MGLSSTGEREETAMAEAWLSTVESNCTSGDELTEQRGVGKSVVRGKAPGLYKLLQCKRSSRSPTHRDVVGVTWSPPLRYVRQTDCPPHSGCQSCAAATIPLCVMAAPRHCWWVLLPAPTQMSTRPLLVRADCHTSLVSSCPRLPPLPVRASAPAP